MLSSFLIITDEGGAMAKDKSNKAIIVLLVIITVLLAAIFVKLCCYSSGKGFCRLKGKGTGKICPYQKKGSPSEDDVQIKDSNSQP